MSVIFFVTHLLVEHRLMAKGVSYDKALEAADKAELAERKKAGDVKKLAGDGNLPDPKKFTCGYGRSLNRR